MPRSKVALQRPGQAMPAGRLVTAPAPLATFWITTETKSCATNFATTVCAELIVTTHGSAVHAPLHPTKRGGPRGRPRARPALPGSNVAVQLAGHEIPGEALETVPVPEPPTATVSANWEPMCASHGESWRSHHVPLCA